MSRPTQRGYQIHYAVFFNRTTASFHSQLNPALPDTLVPLRSIRKFRKKGGSWLSSSSAATLRLVYGTGITDSSSEVVLVITVSGKTHEEHFISKLHFSWPQTSRASDSPAIGGRVVLASYKDSKGHIQKFAMRFLSICDSLSFTNVLKENLKNVKTTIMPTIDSESAFQSQDGCMLMDNLHPNVGTGVNTEYPTSNGTQPVQPSSSDCGQYPFNKETSFSNDLNNTQESVLESFAVILDKRDGCQQEQLNVPKEANPFSYLVKSMSSASFSAMLYSLEKVITDLGGDSSLQPS